MAYKNYLSLLLVFFYAGLAETSLKNYLYPDNSPSYSNYGTLGLLQMPSARFHEEGTVAFNWVNNEPYQRGAVLAYPFSWMEASFQYADINNALYSDVPLFSGNQTYKDKGFSTKIRLWEESFYFPSIAAGVRDIAGTGTFAAEYIVASKRLSNIDISFGLGWGDLSHNNLKNPFSYIDKNFNQRTFISDTQGGDFSPGRYFSGPMGVFGGAEIFLPNLNGARLKIEYDATNYFEEGFPLGRESFLFAFKPVRQSDSRINIGFTYPVNRALKLQAGFIKGNTFTLGFSLHASVGKKDPFIKKNEPHIPVKDAKKIKRFNAKENSNLYITSLNALNDRGLYVQKATWENDTYEVLYAQIKHQSYARATGRIAQVLDEISPDSITKFKISNINAGMLMNTIEVDRESFSKYRVDKISNLAIKNIQIKSDKYDPKKYEFNPKQKFPGFFWSLEPDIRSQIGGPDGFYFGDLRLAFSSELLFASNMQLLTSASVGLYNNMGELKLASDSILPHVRTDVVKYLRATEEVNLKRMQFNAFFEPVQNLYTKISAGLLEEMFAGVGGEILYRPMNQNFAIGVELWTVQQRDYDMLFSMLDYKTKTGHINFYYEEPKTNIVLALKGGKFLAGDSGINVDFSRRFKSGLRMGAFFSVTDISKLEFGEGSFDKGFYFYIPLEVFYSNYSKQIAGWGVRPLTRDGAAYLIHSHYLWGVTEQAQSHGITRDWADLYD
jgi:hypothetical protein